MMDSSSYDEDLLQNPFYKAFITKQKTLYNEAARNRHTICIPRLGASSRSQHTKQQFESHILKVSELNSNLYITANNKEVQVIGSVIVTTKGFHDVKSVKILFQETFFNENEESYNVLCIDQLLEGGGNAFSSKRNLGMENLETVDDCLKFLSKLSGQRRTKRHIDEIISLFISSYSHRSSESLRHAMDAANAVFTRAMQIFLKEAHYNHSKENAVAENIKVAIETYVMNGIFKHIFRAVSSLLADEDASLNKSARNLASIKVKDIGVNPAMWKYIPEAKKELSMLNRLKTPLEKLNVLKRTLSTLAGSNSLKPNQGMSNAALITADDLLPALVFLVIKSEIPNWMANLAYMQKFHFSRGKIDEFQFYLSSVEAAIEHVKSLQLDNLVLNKTPRNGSFGSLRNWSDSYNSPSSVDVFFENIRSNNVEEVRKTLCESISAQKEIAAAMCHPLCSCESCEKMLTGNRRDPMKATVYSRDHMGSTALHQAAEYGSEEVIYDLLKRGAVINSTNYYGSTPLHLACQRGHHKSAAILLHYGADPNSTDNSGNSPIHLAVENGHELCVELLCSNDYGASVKMSFDINTENESGDTPLHIASRWGYANLVEILLANDAEVDRPNKNGKTPAQCALNTKIFELFNDSKIEEKLQEKPLPKTGQVSKLSTKQQHKNEVPHQKSKEEIEFSRLLKSIADGDIALVRQKLGVSDNIIEEYTIRDRVGENDSSCHPLCQCEKCTAQFKIASSESTKMTARMSTQDGVTPLHVAALHGHEQIVSLLLKYGDAEINAKSLSSQRTPLHLACQYNNIESVSTLLDRGAKCNLKDSNGNTALHFCCTNGHIGPAILLLQHGADVHLVNSRGNTPIHDATRWNYVDLVRLLLFYGANIDVTNKRGMKPLDYAKDEEVREQLFVAFLDKQTVKEKPFTRKSTVNISFPEDSELETGLFSSTEKLSHNKSNKRTPNGFKTKKFNESNHPKMSDIHESKHPKMSDIHETNNPKMSDIHEINYPKMSDIHETNNPKMSDIHETNYPKMSDIKKLMTDIEAFDRKRKLRRASSVDYTNTYLFSQKTLMSIRNFDPTTLHKIESNSPDDVT